jgi:hypothetical protein
MATDRRDQPTWATGIADISGGVQQQRLKRPRVQLDRSSRVRAVNSR